jgi:uroporphyrinogen decarboxylase
MRNVPVQALRPEFGGEIKWPTGEFDQAPTVAKDPVKTANDVEKLQVPNIQTAGIVPYMVDVAKQVNASESPYVMCFVNGPFTTATNICGTETFLKWSLKKPELVTHLLDLSSQFLSDLANYWVELFGAEKVLFHAAEPSTSNQLISPRMFKKFALPYIQNVNKNMLDTGCKHIFYHICGEQNSNLEMWAEVPYGHPGLVSFGHEVDLEKASPYFKNHILMGNIEPAKILSGTPQDVYEETKKCIEKGRNHPGGYMLMTGCEFPPMAPEKNVWAIPQAVSDFGWF